MGKIIQGNFPLKQKKEAFCSVIIPCSGEGKRMGLGFNKLLLLINNKPVISYTIDAFETNENISEIIIVCSENDFPVFQKMIAEYRYTKVSKLIIGGNTRQESVYNGLKEISDTNNIVLIHDGARPLISHTIINSVIENTVKYGACAPGLTPKDTVKTTKDNFVIGTLDRQKLTLIQTPQGFKKDIIMSAHQNAYEDNFAATDDTSLVEKFGHKVFVCEGTEENIKLTTPCDYTYIEALINHLFEEQD